MIRPNSRQLNCAIENAWWWEGKKKVENPSIDLGAYRMRSGRSANELHVNYSLDVEGASQLSGV